MIPGLEFWAEQYLDVLDIDSRESTELYAVCPYCGKCKNHFAINLEKGEYHCFRCNAGGSIPFLMVSVDPGFHLPRKTDSEEAMAIAKSYLSAYIKDICIDDLSDYYEDVGSSPVNADLDEIELNGVVPFDSDDLLAKEGRLYWYSRGLSRELAIERGICFGVDGALEGRVVIPCTDIHGDIKSYTARTFIGDDLRYLSAKRSDGWDSIKKYVYGLDRVVNQESTQAHIVLVEGVFDAFSLWEHYYTCALFGKSATKEQALKVLSRYPSKITILLDPKSEKETRDQAPNPEDVAKYFINLVPEVRIAVLEEGDPGDNREGAIKAIEKAEDYFSLGV